MRSDFWLPEKEQALRDMRASGMSFSAIAADMGLTRNACIGKAQRLGLTSFTPVMTPEKKQRRREASARHKAKRRAERSALEASRPDRPVGMRSKERSSVEFIPRTVDIVPLHISLIDLEPHHCRYPYGDSNFTFCGHQKLKGFSYCPSHQKVCWEAAKPPVRRDPPPMQWQPQRKFSGAWA